MMSEICWNKHILITVELTSLRSGETSVESPKITVTSYLRYICVTQIVKYEGRSWYIIFFSGLLEKKTLVD